MPTLVLWAGVVHFCDSFVPLNQEAYLFAFLSVPFQNISAYPHSPSLNNLTNSFTLSHWSAVSLAFLSLKINSLPLYHPHPKILGRRHNALPKIWGTLKGQPAYNFLTLVLSRKSRLLQKLFFSAWNVLSLHLFYLVKFLLIFYNSFQKWSLESLPDSLELC